MDIRAKMKCSSVNKFEACEIISLQAVNADSPENKTYSKYTPAASISMTITNEAAYGSFVAGREYYVDFVQA
jgi:hypothetical protein